MAHDDKTDRMMVESLEWWGVPTLFRAPLATDPSEADIALIGVPHSSGNNTTLRDQHLGPRAVRDISANARRYHNGLGIMAWEAARVRDLGDVPLPEPADNERSIERISDFYRKVVSAGARPVSIGGDHGITGGIVQAIAGEGSPLGEKAALLHFDAHTDTYDELDHWLGARKSAANWASYLVTQGNVDAAKSVQIGMRGHPRSPGWLDRSFELGYDMITMDRYRKEGAAKVIETILERVGDTPLYITFDLDCLDATVAPGVSNLEAGSVGWTVDEVTEILRAMQGRNVLGGDVVCLMPTRDLPNKVTAMVAAAIMHDMVALIADGHVKRQQNG
ncbi:MAG: agmatinase [Pseudonocardiaceae bacterium]|nr:agmatinase [Pseudonocardiaceae bacterium]